MTGFSLTISGPHAAALRGHLFPANGHEAGALILCGVAEISVCPWTSEPMRRYLSHDIIPIPPEDITASSSRNFRWRKSAFLKAYQRARRENLAIGFVHSHRLIQAFFSEVDDINDHELAELVGHRQAPRPDLLSLVMDDSGRVVARRCLSPVERIVLSSVGLLDTGTWRWTFADEISDDDGTFDRQVLAYGPEFLSAIRRLRIAVIGAGATGSATLQLLVRLGARYLAAIDPELVELSNPTRIHGARIADVAGRVPKVEVARRSIEHSGFDVRFLPYQKFVSDREVRDVLRASDVFFGCTDDHEGRLFINRLSLYYNTPLFDMGIKIDPEHSRNGHIRLADGRVTVVAPGLRCLACRKIANPIRARDENLSRSDPEEFGKRRAEGYVMGDFVSAPSVVTLTTSVACMAVDELTARLTNYRRTVDHRLHKFVPMKDHAPGASGAACAICSPTSLGRGDVTPFLNRVG